MTDALQPEIQPEIQPASQPALHSTLHSTLQTIDDVTAMQCALDQAALAQQRGDVPVGAVVLFEGAVIATGHNRREAQADPVGHAEIEALQQAAKVLGRWRLTGCTLVVTLEPCFMCAGALVNARIDRLIYGATDPKAGAVASLASVCSDDRLNHIVEIQGGILEDRCAQMLKAFFKMRREQRAQARK